MINSLPAKYEEAPRKFDNLLDTFGTHFFQRAKFGGYLCKRTMIENSVLYASTEHAIQADLEAGFMKLVTGSLGVGANRTSLSKEFNLRKVKDFYYYGGRYDLSWAKESGNLQEWQRSVSKNPWLNGGQLVPIETLIQNATLQREVQKAVMVKLTRAALQDLRESLHLGGITLPLEEMNLIQEITQYFQYEEYLDSPNEGANEVAEFNGNFGLLFGQVEKIRGKEGVSLG